MLIGQNDEYIVGSSEKDAQVYTPDDVLYQLVMAPQVMEALRAVSLLGGTSYIGSLIDAFLTEAAPYRDLEDPVNSRFLDPEWEKKYGKFYDFRSLVAIGYYLGDAPWFQNRARGIVRELRQKRLARLQQEQIDLSRKLDAGRTELYYQLSSLLLER